MERTCLSELSQKNIIHEIITNVVNAKKIDIFITIKSVNYFLLLLC